MSEPVDPLQRILAARRGARRRRRILGAIGAAAVAGMALALLFWPASSMPAEPLPTPNGYDDLIRGGNLVTQTLKAGGGVVAALKAGGGVVAARGTDSESTWLIHYESPRYIGTADLRDAVERNADAFAALRVGLSRECRMPVVDLDANGPGGVWLDAHRAPSMLAAILRAEATLAHREARPEDVARSYLDLARLGALGPRGGIFNQFWIGLAHEREGLLGLAAARATLPAEEARRVIAILVGHDAARESFQRVEARTDAYRHFVLSRQQPMLAAMWRLDRMIPQPQRAERERVDSATYHDEMRGVVGLSRLLTIDLALRLHRADRGAYPADLASLAPAYLKAVPLDPFTDRPFVYRAVDGDFLLYSLGPDRKDDGGKPLDPKGGPKPPGDLKLQGTHPQYNSHYSRRSN